MKYNMYSIFDRVSGLYGNPFVQVNDASAQRYVKSLFSDGNNDPSDYDLYLVSEWQNLTGEVAPANKPIFICHASDLFEVLNG